MAIWQTLERQLRGSASAACAALFVGALSLPAFAAGTVSITAAPDPAVQGTPVTLSVLVTGMVDLFAYQFSLAFNPAVLQATGVASGSFLAAGGATSFGVGGIDNTTGNVTLVFDSLVGAVPGVSGSGTLATISFSAVAVGSSALTFSDALFLDSALADISVTVQNRVLNVVPIPEPATYALMALGLVAVGTAARRFKPA